MAEQRVPRVFHKGSEEPPQDLVLQDDDGDRLLCDGGLWLYVEVDGATITDESAGTTWADLDDDYEVAWPLTEVLAEEARTEDDAEPRRMLSGAELDEMAANTLAGRTKGVAAAEPAQAESAPGHRNGCQGCDHDEAAYPTCWTDEEVRERAEAWHKLMVGDSVEVHQGSAHLAGTVKHLGNLTGPLVVAVDADAVPAQSPETPAQPGAGATNTPSLVSPDVGPVSSRVSSDLAERLVAAVRADWVTRENARVRGEIDCDWPEFERGAAVAVLRELGMGLGPYHEGLATQCEALANEIEERQQ